LIRTRVLIARLTQHERQSADIRCEQNLLRLLGPDLDRDCFGYGRMLRSLANELIDCEHLHMMQQNVGVALALECRVFADGRSTADVGGRKDRQVADNHNFTRYHNHNLTRYHGTA
jgi:hypothetical protein